MLQSGMNRMTMPGCSQCGKGRPENTCTLFVIFCEPFADRLSGSLPLQLPPNAADPLKIAASLSRRVRVFQFRGELSPAPVCDVLQ